jgi:hypothetical protein
MERTQVDPGPEAMAFGTRTAEGLFRGRKGHGGGPCSYRTFRPAEVAALAALAYEAGLRAASAQAASTAPGTSAKGSCPASAG